MIGRLPTRRSGQPARPWQLGRLAATTNEGAAVRAFSLTAAVLLAAACTGQGDIGVTPEPIQPIRDIEVVEGFAIDVEMFDGDERICMIRVIEVEDHRQTAQDLAVELMAASAVEDMDGSRVAYEGYMRSVGGYLAALDEAEATCTGELLEVVRTEQSRSDTIAKVVEDLRELCQRSLADEGWDC